MSLGDEEDDDEESLDLTGSDEEEDRGEDGARRGR